MKARAFLIAVMLSVAGQAAAQYSGPRIASGNTFVVDSTQPEGVFCMVNGQRRIDGEVVNLTNQVLTVLPLKVTTRVRCRADTLKHGDTVVMFTRSPTSTRWGRCTAALRTRPTPSARSSRGCW
jgi:hypothetical protein